MPKELEISDVYFKLGEIDAKLDSLVTALVTMQSKIVYALIAMAAATLGLKLVGTPPLAVITRYINLFVFTFALALAIGKRRVLRGWQYILVFGVFGMLGNLYYLIFHNHEWLRTCLFIVANSSLALFLWSWDSWDKSSKPC